MPRIDLNTLDQNGREEAINDALAVLRQDYWDDVRNVAADVKRAADDGEIGNRDDLIEYIDETCDGTQRVIYTREAILALLFSDNDSAYVDDFGSEGITDDSGNIHFSRLAYFAFQRDVVEQLRADGIDVNDWAPDDDDDEESE